MENNERLILFVNKRTKNASSVRLGSGVEIPIALETKRVILGTGDQKAKPRQGINLSRIPKAPEASSSVTVDGVEFKVERTVLRYEKLEEVFDELPEFAQEILQDSLES